MYRENPQSRAKLANQSIKELLAEKSPEHTQSKNTSEFQLTVVEGLLSTFG